jgi:DNA polymerase III epsilon subunit-like protein
MAHASNGKYIIDVKPWDMRYDETKNDAIAVDFELYEHNHDKIIEVGFTTYDKNTKTFESTHFIVEEYEHLNNGRYVPNNKWRFLYGSSKVVPLDDAMECLAYEMSCSYMLVGHGMREDLRVIGKYMPDVSDWRRFDTQTIFKTLHPNVSPSLKNMNHALGIKCQHLHNAGNDARCTLEGFIKMVDIYRSAAII